MGGASDPSTTSDLSTSCTTKSLTEDVCTLRIGPAEFLGPLLPAASLPNRCVAKHGRVVAKFAALVAEALGNFGASASSAAS